MFVGDGPSDRYAMHHADIVFATGHLLALVPRQRLPGHRPGPSSIEVADALAGLLADGWAAVERRRGARLARRTRGSSSRPPFICGPEVWGPGMTVPPRPIGV